MKRLIVAVALLASLLAGGASAQDASRTVKLQVENLWCASCNYIVRQALIETPGCWTPNSSTGPTPPW